MSRCIIKSLPDMAKARNRVDQAKVIYDDFKPSEALLSFAKGKKYLVKTFGCQGNVRDEEVISGYLEKMGYAPAASEEDADIVIINTCAVRENAEDKVYGEIGKFKAKSRQDPDFVLGICHIFFVTLNLSFHAGGFFFQILQICIVHQLFNFRNFCLQIRNFF